MLTVQNGLVANVGSAQLPLTGSVFEADAVTMQRRMRYNPLPSLTPANLSSALDDFDRGILHRAAVFWDAMIRRDDTLSFVVPQMASSIAGKPWAVQRRKGADPVEAARHAVALEHFWNNVTATDAFDRNVRGTKHLLLRQMSGAYAHRYVAHHFIWQPRPGVLLPVPLEDGEEAAPVPALTATLEMVPLWYFENTSGTLRLLRQSGYGIEGEDLDWEGEWVCTTGEGMMFAASACYVFKRLGFQDWTNFNERYASPKVVGMTNATRDSEPGRHMLRIVGDFNGDMGICLYEVQDTTNPPIALLGPEGTASVDVFERFLKRQDEKLTTMFRGGAQSTTMADKKETGISAQIDEREALELAHCAAMSSACREIDRRVIRFCFGDEVEPLAFFGLPDMDQEDAAELRESLGFLADRGVLVDAETAVERLGVTTTTDPAKALGAGSAPEGGPDAEPDGRPTSTANSTPNAAGLVRLEELVRGALRTANGDLPGHDFHGNQWTNPVTLPDEHWAGSAKEMHAKADAIMRGLGSVQHPKLGTVRFSSDGRGKTLADKRKPHEFQAVQALPALVERSTWVKSAPDRDGSENVVAFHTLHAALQIGEAKYHAELTVKETKDRGASAHKFYLHRLHEK